MVLQSALQIRYGIGGNLWHALESVQNFGAEHD